MPDRDSHPTHAQADDLQNLASAPGTTTAAILVTGAAAVDTLAPTPEDLAVPIGFADEVSLWAGAGVLWGNALQGKTLDETSKEFLPP